MKRRYQIDREKAVRRFREDAEQDDREIQLHLPLKEVAAFSRSLVVIDNQWVRYGGMRGSARRSGRGTSELTRA